MAPDTTRFYAVRPAVILELAEGRRRRILARKAVAGLFKLGSTKSLPSQEVHDDVDVEEILGKMVDNGFVYSIQEGWEPRDPADRSKEPVSLEAFMREHQANLSVFVDKVNADVKELVDEEDFDEAYALISEVLDDIPSEFYPRLMASLERVGAVHAQGRACLARTLLEPEVQDVERAISLLEGLLEDKDPDAVGLASAWLGDYYRMQPFGARKALRTFEIGASNEDGYCAYKAGYLCEHGGDGLPVDLMRAARNYRWGVEDGDDSCMVALAVLIARGDVEPVPEDGNWRVLLKAASEVNDRGLAYLRLIASIEREAGRDRKVLAERLRAAGEPVLEPGSGLEFALREMAEPVAA